MKIAIGSDHAGYEYKEYLKQKVEALGHKVIDYGTNSPDSVDYPDFAHPVSESVQGKKAKIGILVCGSGNGVSMTANKHKNVRAAICWTSEIAKLARQHNNANVICVPARFVTKRLANNMVKHFLTTEFEGGRHKRRVGKIACL